MTLGAELVLVYPTPAVLLAKHTTPNNKVC